MTFKPNKPTRYNMEKVLYFANRPCKLHVAPTEHTRKTTLSNLIDDAMGKGWIEDVADDESGRYYGITQLGIKELSRLQALWRAQHAH